LRTANQANPSKETKTQKKESPEENLQSNSSKSERVASTNTPGGEEATLKKKKALTHPRGNEETSEGRKNEIKVKGLRETGADLFVERPGGN